MQPNSVIDCLTGTLPAEPRGNTPFNEAGCSLLTALSAALMKTPEAKKLPDVMAFAFWCRTAHLKQLAKHVHDKKQRLGRGLAFHISPSNVPINAFYSFAFGLLSGNANIVRLPSKSSQSVDLVLSALSQLFKEKRFQELGSENAFVRYDHTSLATDEFSAVCDVRIIWGGDKTIAQVRKSPIAARTTEIAFADRYSFAVIDAETIAAMPDKPLERAAAGFFNDTLQMDQNACSSPHLIVWINSSNAKGKSRFWQALKSYTESNYSIEPVQAVDRYTRLLSGFTQTAGQKLITELSAPVQRVQLHNLPADTDKLRGLYGLFYEYDAATLDEVAHIVNKKYQTLTYLGVEPSELSEFVISNRLRGIDRIVPVGNALDIDVIWDGHDVLKELTRIIDVR